MHAALPPPGPWQRRPARPRRGRTALAANPLIAMASHHRQNVRRRRRALRRRLFRALAVSVALHGALLALWRTGPGPVPGSAGDAAAPSPARTPEEALRAVSVRVRRAEAGEGAVRPADRLPEAGPAAAREPASTGLSLEPVPASGAPRLALSGSGGAGSSGREGVAAGDSSAISPPVPRSLLPQWSPPDEVRGTRVTVHVEVGPDGRPTGHVRLEPPTGSESFNRRLREALTSIRYRPATLGGSPVTAWAEITFVF